MIECVCGHRLDYHTIEDGCQWKGSNAKGCPCGRASWKGYELPVTERAPDTGRRETIPVTAYKLTDQHGRTHGNMQWGPGVTHTVSGEGDLCGPGWIHVYSHPLLASLLNPLHADFLSPRLWVVVCEGTECTDHGLKSGWTRVTMGCEIPCPTITPVQRVRFGILCAQTADQAHDWRVWAACWLSGADRSRMAARATGWAAAESAAWAADAAAWAADAAARATEEAWAIAKAAARAAAEAATWAAEAAPLDLIALALQAMKEETP